MYSPFLKSRWLTTSVIFTSFVFAGFLIVSGYSNSQASSDEPLLVAKRAAVKAKKTVYKGTIFVAATSGGHVAKATVTIDPSNKKSPITIEKLKRIMITKKSGADNKTHNIHDIRLSKAEHRLYYSSILADKSGGKDQGRVHAGYIDLVKHTQHDVTIDVNPEDPKAKIGIVYCASGHTKDFHIPITMGYPAYFDAIPKSKFVNGKRLSSAKGDVKRTMIGDFRGKDGNYIFAHGSASPDGSKLFVAVCKTKGGGGKLGTQIGAWDLYMLKMSDVVAGKVTKKSILDSGTLTGMTAKGGSMAFRSTWTPDGSKILQGGVNRFVVLDANNLSAPAIINTRKIGGSKVAVENHDVMSTPDGKYAILAIRYRDADGVVEDGGIQLFDLKHKKTIGDPVSTCNACHDVPIEGDRKLCGIDGVLKIVKM